MSFESARRILQQYQQSNTQRISESLDFAYKEALTAYQSEEKAREAALKVLENETKIFNTYLKEIQRSRRDIIKGNIDIAKQNAINARKNLVGQAEVDRKNQNDEIKRQNKIALNKHKQDEANRRSIENARRDRAIASSGEPRGLQQEAENYSNKKVKMSNIANTPLTDSITNIATLLKSKVSPTQLYIKGLVPLVNPAHRMYTVAPTASSAYDKDMTEALPFRKADTAHHILNRLQKDVEDFDEDHPKYQQVYDFLYEKNSKEDTKNVGGMFSDVKDITRDDVDEEYNRQINEYKLDKAGTGGGGRGRSYTPTRAGLAPDPTPLVKRKFIPHEEIEEAEVDLNLRKLAQPVFDALRDRNTPYELTEAERFWAGKEAIDAYEKLKEVSIRNPLAVTRDEQLLLDDLALQRQLNIYRQKERIGKMNPRMASPDRVRSRAADLIEPTKVKETPPDLSPTQQKYFAVERKALDLSEKSDEDIRNMGTPEQAGLSIYQEMFDQKQKQFLPGNSYDTVLSKLEENFQGLPEDFLRANAAFISRAMALSRAGSPILLPDGKKNQYYLDALKSTGLSPKEK